MYVGMFTPFSLSALFRTEANLVARLIYSNKFLFPSLNYIWHIVFLAVT